MKHQRHCKESDCGLCICTNIGPYDAITKAVLATARRCAEICREYADRAPGGLIPVGAAAHAWAKMLYHPARRNGGGPARPPFGRDPALFSGCFDGRDYGMDIQQIIEENQEGHD